ncbi:MAG: HEPN domain-containing protein [Chloroflexi bacterium]|nr:HEPN domain-containing protein [Chloroflexota bacterium]
MQPERFPPDDPREWMNRARSNLTRARVGVGPGVYLEDPCFDAQQAAEKSFKALILYRGLVFPYTHDLAELLTILLQAGEGVPEGARQAGRLTRYALVTRYPFLSPPVTRQEHEDAVGIAEAVVRWVEEQIGYRS